MNNQSFLQKLNPKILVIALAFLVVFVFISLLALVIKPSAPGKNTQELLTPTPVPLNIPPDAIVPTPDIKIPETALLNRLGDVSFSVFSNTFPQKAVLYTFTPGSINLESAQKIAQSLSFASSTNTQDANGATVSFKDTARTLTFYLDSGNIMYFSASTISQRNVENIEAAVEVAQDYLKKFNSLAQGLTTDTNSITYLKGLGEPRQVESFENADFYTVPFVEKIDGLPVFPEGGSSARAIVMVNSAGQVQKAGLYVPDILSGGRSENLISITEAKNKILLGEGRISDYGRSDQLGVLPVPERTIFSKAEIAYFRDTVNKTLYPIFVFKGIAFTGSQEEPIVVYLPAVK